MNNALIKAESGFYPVHNAPAPASSPQKNTNYRRYLLFLRRWWCVPLIAVLLAVGCVAVLNHWEEPQFISSAFMWETEKLVLPGGAAFSEDSQTYMGTQLELLRNEALAERTVEHLESAKARIPRGRNGLPPEVTITVRQLPKSTIFQVEASSSDPDYSQEYLDALLQEYVSYKRGVRKAVSGDTLASISSEVQRMEADLKTEQEALNDYTRSNNLAVLQEEAMIGGSHLAKLQTELSDLKLESKLLETAAPIPIQPAGATNATTDLHLLVDEGRSNPGTISSAGPLTADEEVELLKMQREKLSKYLRPKHPKIVRLDSQIERNEKIIEMVRTKQRENLMASRQTNKEKMTNVIASIQEWQGKVTEANRLIAEAERLKQNVSRTQATYDRLTQLLQNVDLSRNIDQETLAILQTASPARRAKSKETKTLEAAAFGGLGFGLGLVFLIAVRDDRFNSIAEVNEKFGDVILGQVPALPRSNGHAEPLLLALDDKREMYAESYRNLRSAIFFMQPEVERPRILLVTSALPGEGKSTIAVNLARTLAQGSARVLLIDADLRKGRLHELLGLASEPGLTDLLGQSCGFEQVIQQDTLPGLYFIASGKETANPGDLFLNAELAQFFSRVRSEYDYVIFDTSPVFAADDSPTLAPKADGTLFVVRNGYSPARVVKEALELLGQRQVKILGLIFNQADSAARNYYYYKYSDYYRRQKQA